MLCSEEVFNKAFIKKNKNEKLIKYFKRSSSDEDEIRKLRQENDELIKIINERNPAMIESLNIHKCYNITNHKSIGSEHAERLLTDLKNNRIFAVLDDSVSSAVENDAPPSLIILFLDNRIFANLNHFV